MVRDQVLRRLAQRLPPEMQLLEAALGAAGGMARMALLRRHAAQSPEKLAAAREAEAGSSGGSGSAAAGGGAGNDAGGEAGDDAGGAGGSGPSYPSLHCLACDLERACGQVIQDMELMPEVPDRWVGGLGGRGGEGGGGRLGDPPQRQFVACTACLHCVLFYRATWGATAGPAGRRHPSTRLQPPLLWPASPAGACWPSWCW